MADSRKYYYLKLKENYFDDDSIVLLESMPDGILYSNILLKLYLKSLKHGGKLQLEEHIPYTAQMIATLTRHQVGTVERALDIFQTLGLVEPLPDGSYYMSNIELLIGRSSTEGERKRQARLALKAQEEMGKLPGHLSAVCPPEREQEIKRETERKREIEAASPPHALGRYHNVLLSDDDCAALQNELSANWMRYVEKLSAYMASTGKQYQNHAATILRWAEKDRQTPVGASRNYTVEAGDTV